MKIDNGEKCIGHEEAKKITDYQMNLQNVTKSNFHQYFTFEIWFFIRFEESLR